MKKTYPMTINDARYGDILKPTPVAAGLSPDLRLMFVQWTAENGFAGVLLNDDSRTPAMGLFWGRKGWEPADD